MSKHLAGALGATLLAIVALAALAAVPTSAAPPPGADQIKHIVFILKENHTFDNYFGAFPGADGASIGEMFFERPFPLRDNPPDLIPQDIAHDSASTLSAMDFGRMDGFDLIAGAYQGRRWMNYTRYGQNQIPNYWTLASNFVLADEFFTSVHGPSFPNHLFTIAAQSGGTQDNPTGGIWGCDAPLSSTVPVLQNNGKFGAERPCFDFTTVADSLNSAGLTWRYYGARERARGYQWSPFDAVRHIRRGPQWKTNVLPEAQFVGDLAANNLATMTWITTGPQFSEHPSFGGSCAGENSTVTLVNAIMNSPQWNSTVIFISWDDFGGFYDHVPPPQVDRLGMGPRVPMLIVSPFVKAGFIEHQQLEFASIVKFIEEVFGLPFLTARDTNSNDIFDAFDFVDAPLAPMPLQTQTCRR
jgi:phospholipase C